MTLMNNDYITTNTYNLPAELLLSSHSQLITQLPQEDWESKKVIAKPISTEHSKRITQMVGAPWKFTDETLEQFKMRTYGHS